MTTGSGGKVVLASRLFLRELTDLVDYVDQHQDFDPNVHHKLANQGEPAPAEELAAMRG